MDKFRKYEVWDDYWCFEPFNEPELELLKTLDYYCWKPRENNKINIRIESYDNYTVSPSNKQIEVYEFVIKNQDRILEGIWNYYINLVLPIYQSATDIEDNEIANKKSDLSIVFGVRAIEIPPIDDVNSFYFLIEFDFCYDCEHGLYLLFKNDIPIDLFDEGNKDYDATNIYQKGLYNEDGSPLKILITSLNGESMLEGEYQFDEEIQFDLHKGPYRIFYTINESERVRNFIVKESRVSFTLKHVLKNCEGE
ncbi:MAG: hypothetical protein NVV82_22605 [Sporocytophaga sp.]|nr:hypothetical protein [Sporocytophaga sp.]